MEQFLGQLALFPWSVIPKGWLPCQGQLLPINGNQALFSLIGTTFGGDGRVNFALPELRGRTPISFSPSYPVGARSGEEFHTLTAGEVPQHNHLIMASTNPAEQVNKVTSALVATSNPAVYRQAMPDTSSPLVNTTLTSYGGSQGHENRTPFLAMNWCIAISGIFPTRQ